MEKGFPYVILEFFPIESNPYMSIIQLRGKFLPVRQVFQCLEGQNKRIVRAHYF
jgi:hypothetical protein